MVRGVQHEISEFDEDYLGDIDDIVSACGGLIIVDQGKDTYTVRLVHYSTQEYLRPAEEIYFPDARRELALSCLTYLLYDRFEEVWYCRSSDPNPDQRKSLPQHALRYPFLLYAAVY